MIWSRYPLFRIFLFYTSGILCYNFFALPVWIILFFISAGLALFFSFLLVLKQKFSRYRNVHLTAAYMLLFFGTGAGISGLYLQDFNKNHLRFKAEDNQSHLFLAEVTKAPKQKARTISLEVKVVASDDGKEDGKAMLYIRKNKAAREIEYGDRIWIKTKLQKLEPPKNPYEFDYRDYLNLKAIYFQSFVDSTNWIPESKGHGLWLIDRSIGLRNRLMKQLDAWHLDRAETAITKALILGYRDEVDDELLASYSAAGATHVLAVSGLHVGIIYVVASSLLFFLNGFRTGEIIKSILLVLLLWSYALLTGLSPSVVRAATMFTFVAIGSNLQKKTSIYNTILVSAFLLLTIKPTYLFEVGFQLSYLAVFGIVWLQPRFESLLKPKTWVLRQLWSITTVSIAAQIATFPMGLYYFHQFPGLFLVSNLMVIPLVTLLMYVGLTTLIIQLLFGLWPPLLWLFTQFLQWMNAGVRWVETFDAFLWNQIHINRVELVVFYLLIGFFFTWIFKGGYRKLVVVSVLCFGLLGYQLVEESQLKEWNETVIYNTSSGPAIGVYQSNRGLLLADSLLLKDDDALTFHVKHHWWANNIDSVGMIAVSSTEVENVFLIKKKDFIQTPQTSILLYNHKKEILTADVWLVSQFCYPPDSIFHVDEMVFTKKYFNNEAWQLWCEKAGTKVIYLDEGSRSF